MVGSCDPIWTSCLLLHYAISPFAGGLVTLVPQVDSRSVPANNDKGLLSPAFRFVAPDQ